MNVYGATYETSIEIENAILTQAVIEDGELYFQKGDGSTTDSLGRVVDTEIPVVESIVTLSSFDSDPVTVMIPEWWTPDQLPGNYSTSLIADGGVATAMDWSPDAKYLAVAFNATPYLAIHEILSDGSLLILSDFVSGLTSSPHAVKWSPDGQYLAVATNNSSEFGIYKRTGTTFTKITPASLPSGVCNSVSWTPDGKYLAVGTSSGTGIYFYLLNSDVLTSQTPVPTLAGACSALAFSPSGYHLVVCEGNATYPILIYNNANPPTSLVPGSFPSTLPPSASYGLSWSPNGKYLAVSNASASPELIVYKRDENLLTAIYTRTLTDGVKSVTWSPDGRHLLIVPNLSSGIFYIYRQNENVFTRLPDIFGDSVSLSVCAWSPDGQYLVAGYGSSSSRLRVYKSSNVQPKGFPQPKTIIY